eukprot:2057130-Prymnesium_polylepis.1
MNWCTLDPASQKRLAPVPPAPRTPQLETSSSRSTASATIRSDPYVDRTCDHGTVVLACVVACTALELST